MNHYAKAIEIITQQENEAYEIMVEIAKHNPGAVVRAYLRIHPPEPNKIGLPAEALTIKVAEIMKQGGHGALATAVKLVRGRSFMSLKEAKDFVDTITARLAQ